jgi:hypothetical protein
MKTCVERCHVLVNTMTLLGICVAGLASCIEEGISSGTDEESFSDQAHQECISFHEEQPERALEAHGRPLYPTTIEPPDLFLRSFQIDSTNRSRNILIIGFDHNHRKGRENSMNALDALLTKTPIKKIAFEFPGDLQEEFDTYFASKQSPREMMKLAHAMVSHYPGSFRLTRLQKMECAGKIMYSEAIHCLIDVAWIARQHGAGVLLVDTPMAEVTPRDRKIVLRNKAMSRTLMKFSNGEPILLLVGNAHIGHGSLGLSLDDQLNQLGASTMSICTDPVAIRPQRDLGNELATADYHLTKPSDIASLVASRFSGE